MYIFSMGRKYIKHIHGIEQIEKMNAKNKKNIDSPKQLFSA